MVRGGPVSERGLIREIMLALSARGHRMFRQNVGMGWTGTVHHAGDVVTITNPRPIHAGLCTGSADLIGWTREGTFLAVEVKGKRTSISKAQKDFLAAVQSAGGRAGIARSTEDAIRIAEDEK